MKELNKAEELQGQTGMRIGESYESVMKEEYGPFTIVGTERGTFVAFGHFRLTDLMENSDQCKKIIDEKDWDFLINLILLLCDSTVKTANDKQTV